MLYLIPTPIGNLQDITLRAIDMLKNLHYLICEDTRSTKKLMQLLDIEYSGKQFYSLTSFTNAKQIQYYVDLIRNNDIGLVSDAGTPWLSDPGKSLIAMCHEHQLPYSVLPGATALIPAVVGSGFDTSQFVFVGFLPKKKGKQTLLREIVWLSPSGDVLDCHASGSQWQQRAYFFYESVHRVQKILQELYDMWFRGKVSIAREVSKMHEQLMTAPIEEVLELFKEGKIMQKGEFVVGVYNIL